MDALKIWGRGLYGTTIGQSSADRRPTISLFGRQYVDDRPIKRSSADCRQIVGR